MNANAITLGISIARPPDTVYAFAANVENLPLWAKAFCRSVHKDGETWIAETPFGPVSFRMAAHNAFRILDHHVTLSPGVEVYVPMRVLANNANSSEVILTLFRQPRMSNADYKRDQTMVAHDLAALKQAVETDT